MFLMALAVQGCKTTSPEASDNNSKLEGRGLPNEGQLRYNENGLPFMCYKPGKEQCFAPPKPVDPTFQAACAKVKGVMSPCGACVQYYGCSKQPIEGLKFQDENGQATECGPHNPQVFCAKMNPPKNPKLEKSCKASGGTIVRCDACRQTLTCAIYPKTATQGGYIDESGQTVDCPTRDENIYCTLQVTAPSDDQLRNLCKAKKGSLVTCGACGHEHACKLD